MAPLAQTLKTALPCRSFGDCLPCREPVARSRVISAVHQPRCDCTLRLSFRSTQLEEQQPPPPRTAEDSAGWCDCHTTSTSTHSPHRTHTTSTPRTTESSKRSVCETVRQHNRADGVAAHTRRGTQPSPGCGTAGRDGALPVTMRGWLAVAAAGACWAVAYGAEGPPQAWPPLLDELCRNGDLASGAQAGMRSSPASFGEVLLALAPGLGRRTLLRGPSVGGRSLGAPPQLLRHCRAPRR